MFKYIIVCMFVCSLVDGLIFSYFGKLDYVKVLEQYNVYICVLQICDVDIILLLLDECFFDLVFVEDLVFCILCCVIIICFGVELWCGEIEIIEEIVQCFYLGKVECIEVFGMVEVGDIMMVGDYFYIGELVCINVEGVWQMIVILEKYGFSGLVVCLEKVLYLKIGFVYLEYNNLLVVGEFVSKLEFQDFNIIEIFEEEFYVVNCIWVNERVIMFVGYFWICEKIVCFGYWVIEVDIFEYCKIDGGVSCMLLCF